MKERISIDANEYKCLREHLRQAFEIFKGFEAELGGILTAPNKSRKPTHQERKDKYDFMLKSKAQYRKSNKKKK